MKPKKKITTKIPVPSSAAKNGDAKSAKASSSAQTSAVPWATLTKQARSTWAGLSEQDCSGLGASPERLYGLIAERFSETPEAVKRKLEAFKL